eukprot:Gb_36833 [translate_table: standard]
MFSHGLARRFSSQLSHEMKNTRPRYALTYLCKGWEMLQQLECTRYLKDPLTKDLQPLHFVPCLSVSHGLLQHFLWDIAKPFLQNLIQHTHNKLYFLLVELSN